MRLQFGCIGIGVLLVVSIILSGCGSTRWTDTSRTATEQLLISDAMDRAVSEVDFQALSGREVFLDSTPAQGVTDHAYLISSLRQHILASGCVLRDSREKAECIVELRVGAVGTDTHKLTLGVPAVEMPSAISLTGAPSSIPEIPFAKKTEQRAVAKIALFAYERESGQPIWQSGFAPVESMAKDIWFLGMGPFRRGTIYKGTHLAGDKFVIPIIVPGEDQQGNVGSVAVADEVVFDDPEEPSSESGKTDKEPKEQVAKAEASKPKATKAVAKTAIKAEQKPDDKIIAVAHSETSPKKNLDVKKDNAKKDTAKPVQKQTSALTAPWPFRNGETIPPRRLPSCGGLPIGSAPEAMKTKLSGGNP